MWLCFRRLFNDMYFRLYNNRLIQWLIQFTVFGAFLLPLITLIAFYWSTLQVLTLKGSKQITVIKFYNNKTEANCQIKLGLISEVANESLNLEKSRYYDFVLKRERKIFWLVFSFFFYRGVPYCLMIL